MIDVFQDTSIACVLYLVVKHHSGVELINIILTESWFGVKEQNVDLSGCVNTSGHLWMEKMQQDCRNNPCHVSFLLLKPDK